MNRVIFFSMLLFLTAIPLVSAVPMIQNVNVQPPHLWLGEDAVISLNCLDNENNTIGQVYANVVGPDVILPTLYPASSNENYYEIFVGKEHLDRTGQFDATIYCQNNLSNETSNLTSFTVSKLTGYISGINPYPAYTGETMEIDFIVKRNDAKISSDVIFNVSVNNQLKALKVAPAYDNNKGWLLKVNPPSEPGIYDIKVVAFYDRTKVINYSSVEVRNNIEFNIESIDKNWVNSNDNITVTLRALEKGNAINLNKNNINIKINSANAEITTISKHDNLVDVKIIAPTLSAGRYELDAYLDHEDSYYSDSKPIDYIVSIGGTLIDANSKAMSVQLRFIQNDVTKLSMTTDSYGHYSGSIPPDNYDLEIKFPQSTLYLDDISISNFDDPIKYFYSDEFDLPGIRNHGLYDYSIALSYSSARIEMIYTEKNMVNENNLKIFKCSNWNPGRKICNSVWSEINGDIDIVRNKARINSTTLSAFVIGEIKGISVDFSLDKEIYGLNDKILVRGIAKDEDRNSVSNASIEAYIKNTGINYRATADENGIFSLEIQTPKDEGKYELVLKVKKNPYREFNGNKNFEVIKSKSILIDFPDTIKIAKGENLTQNLSLLNNGQADIENLKVYFEGMPESYYKFSENISLESGEQKALFVDFNIPFYAEIGVSSATLKIEGNKISQEKVFGLNIVERNESSNQTLPTTGLASGFTLPDINYLDIAFIALFAVACFSSAIILKKRKTTKRSRDNIKNILFEIKGTIKSNETRLRPQSNEKSIYDKLILTQFPNFLNFSKKLIKTGSDDGKDN